LAEERREVPAGRVAAHRQPGRVGPERLGVLDDPGEDGQAVLERSRRTVLGREPVVHRHDDAPGASGQQAARGVGRLEVADDPAAAVEPDEQPPVGPHGLGRRVHADGHVAVGAGHGAVVDPLDLDQRLHHRQPAVEPTGVGEGQVGEGRAPGRGHPVEQLLHLRVERHRTP
jgi:hypothetical protein